MGQARCARARLAAAFAIFILTWFFPACGDKTAQTQPTQKSELELRFPGYKPKETPDTVLDYRPSLSGRIQEVPAADLASLPALLVELGRYQSLTAKNPGRWRTGSVALGADPSEYEPSDEELLAGELGDRLARVVAGEPQAAVREALAKSGFKETSVVYGRILFRHSDVMGSGRFFYASPPVITSILF